MSFFFFNDTATTEIYTLSLHDALPIFVPVGGPGLLERALGRRKDDRVQARIDGVDVLEVRAHDLDRRDLLRADRPRQPAGGGANDITHVLPGESLVADVRV